MKHVMIDIETLGTSPGSVVVSVGACRFDETGIATERFYRPIDVFDSLMAGLTTDPATVGWWRMQEPAAKAALVPGRPLRETLTDLMRYLQAVEETYVWAKGPDFDLVMLAAAYRALNMKQPWHYRRTRDVRTILALAGAVEPVALPGGEKLLAHHALSDALYQAAQVISAAAALGVPLVRG